VAAFRASISAHKPFQNRAKAQEREKEELTGGNSTSRSKFPKTFALDSLCPGGKSKVRA
jgi:hypothetical protein